MSRRDLDRDTLFKSILGDLGGSEESPSGSTISISQIRFNEDQPRRHFDDEALTDLAESISSRGVLEPVLVRRVGDAFELIAGERRTRAAMKAGLQQIPAVILDVGDNEALEISIMENLQREDLNAVEETEAVLRLLELHFRYSRQQVVNALQEIYNEERGRGRGEAFTAETKQELRTVLSRLGRFTPSSFFVNRVPILEFPEELLTAVRSGELEFTKAQAITRVRDARRRRKLLDDALREGLTLSQIRARAKEQVGKTDDTSLELEQTRKLLTGRRIARLPARQRSRVEKLLAELRGLLED